MKAVLILLCIAYTQCSEINKKQWNSIIQKVNSARTTWKAGYNFDPSISPDSFKPMLGAILDNNVPNKRDFVKKHNGPKEPIPKEFDARKKWPECKSISHIRDQGGCGSCWAVAAAEAFTDRYCIAMKGKANPQLSALDVLSCCNDCGHGCSGGNPWSAWNYFRRYGVVTGSDFHSRFGCKPYSFEPCGYREYGSKPQCLPHADDLETPTCHYRCTNKNYRHMYDHDKHKVSQITVFGVNDTEALQRDIMTYGPVEAGFVVYKDFMTYQSGIYQHITGKSEGGHAVKVIGWGEENNVKYWLAANSWNTNWGENGYFRIKRGNNECDFESFVVSGIPAVTKKK